VSTGSHAAPLVPLGEALDHFESFQLPEGAPDHAEWLATASPTVRTRSAILHDGAVPAVHKATIAGWRARLGAESRAHCAMLFTAIRRTEPGQLLPVKRVVRILPGQLRQELADPVWSLSRSAATASINCAKGAR